MKLKTFYNNFPPVITVFFYVETSATTCKHFSLRQVSAPQTDEPDMRYKFCHHKNTRDEIFTMMLLGCILFIPYISGLHYILWVLNSSNPLFFPRYVFQKFQLSLSDCYYNFLIVHILYGILSIILQSPISVASSLFFTYEDIAFSCCIED